VSEKEEYVSLEKALKELRLKEEELKRLVSEGEIRAFRDADKMKFKREDIEKLKQDTGRTIQYTNESSDTLTDDLLFDEGNDDLDFGKGGAGMATAPLSPDETFRDEEPKKPAPAAKKTGSSTSMRGKTSSQPAPKPKTSSEPAAKKSTGGAAATGRTTSIRATTGGSSSRPVVKRDPAEIGPVWVAVTLVTTIVMIYACAFWWDISTGTGMSGSTEGLATWASETFIAEK
jgi:hypothetical protein